MFVSVMPLFNSEMAVYAYAFSSQSDSNYLAGGSSATSYTLSFDMINSIGLDALTLGLPVFVPVDNIALLLDLGNFCNAQPDKIILLLDKSVQPIPMYLDRIKYFKEQGFKFALRNVSNYDRYSSIISLMNYMFLNYQKIDIMQAKLILRKHFKELKLVAANINSVSQFRNIQYNGFDLYEGEFYRFPLTLGGNTSVVPLKVNYIQLLNIVLDENFEIGAVADIVQKDTALAISLLNMVNSLGLASEIKSIKHAAAILGQSELRQWITTAVANKLYADKPNEITKVSLIRGKFAENLAPLFEMAMSASELFMLGLFSVLDIILEMPMEQTLQLVLVSGHIREALVNNKGPFATVLNFVKAFEIADWPEVSRLVIVHQLSSERITMAYKESLKWYSRLISSLDE